MYLCIFILRICARRKAGSQYDVGPTFRFVSSRHRFPSSHSVMLSFVTLFTIYHQLDVSDWRPRIDSALTLHVWVMNPYIPVSDHILA